METDLKRIKKLARKKEEENWEFRTFLKGYSGDLDKAVHRIYNEVSSHIDCTSCGNCCRKVHPTFDQQDVEKL